MRKSQSWQSLAWEVITDPSTVAPLPWAEEKLLKLQPGKQSKVNKPVLPDTIMEDDAMEEIEDNVQDKVGADDSQCLGIISLGSIFHIIMVPPLA